MPRYIEFPAADGGHVLVEVADDAAAGIAKAGLRGRAEDAVGTAAATFEAALTSAVKHNVDALAYAIDALATTPAEVELTFALKATGELGLMAIGKLGGEANFTVRLLWRNGEANGS